MQNSSSFSSSYSEHSEHSEQSEPRGVSILAILFFAVVGAAIGHCWWVGDHVATGTTAIIGMGGAVGYWYGIWRTIGSSVGLYMGYQYASPAAAQLVPILEKQIGQSIPATTALLFSGALVGIGVTLVFFVVGVVMFRRSQTLKQHDRKAGFVFGLLNSTSIVALTLWGLLTAEPKIQELQQIHAGQNNQQANSIASKLDLALIATKKSYVMIALRGWNPFDEVAYLKNAKEQWIGLIAGNQVSENRNAGSFQSNRPTQGDDMQKLIQALFQGSNDKIK